MSLDPLLCASPAIQLHAFVALAAFVLGLAQFSMAKGTRPHRALGYTWVVLMMAVAGSSFWIHTIKQWRGFSAIHLLSILVLIAVPSAVYAARKGNVASHRRIMIRVFVGGLVVAGAFTFLPGRIMHAVAFGPQPAGSASTPKAAR